MLSGLSFLKPKPWRLEARLLGALATGGRGKRGSQEYLDKNVVGVACCLGEPLVAGLPESLEGKPRGNQTNLVLLYTYIYIYNFSAF